MLQTAISVGVLTLVVASAGDRAPRTGRVIAGPASAQRVAASALPAFARFGWVSPPVDSTTPARIAELVGGGLNLLLPAWADSGEVSDNLNRLDLAAANGARCLIWDRRFEQFMTLDVNSPEGGALLDQIVGTYRTHAGFAGYYLGHEPDPSIFSLLGKLHAALRARDPDHPAYNNLLSSVGVHGWSNWSPYVHAYLDSTGAQVLSYDEYDFLESGDQGVYVQDLAGAHAMAREYGIPFWVIALVTQHGPYRALGDGEVRWQGSMALAYAAGGVGWFTYWTPPPDPVWNWQYGLITWDGARTHWYDLLAAFDPRLGAAGEVLARLTWLATQHAGSVPAGGTAFTPSGWIASVEGRAALGMFADSLGGRYVLLASSDSAAARTIAVTFPGARGIERLADDGRSWSALDTTHAAAGVRIALDLPAGDFALLRVLGPGEPLRTGAGPGLRVQPNPASGQVRFDLAAVHGPARLEILDAGGRHVWGRDLSPGSSSVTWDGAREGGGPAPAGLYFARAEDQGGVTALRLTWLGAK